MAVSADGSPVWESLILLIYTSVLSQCYPCMSHQPCKQKGKIHVTGPCTSACMADRTGFQNTNLQAQADATWQQHNSAFFTPSSLFTPLQLFTPSFLFMPSSLVCSGAMEGPNCTCTNQKDFCSLTVGIFVPVSFLFLSMPSCAMFTVGNTSRLCN
jgi:hypothetical protein